MEVRGGGEEVRGEEGRRGGGEWRRGGEGGGGGGGGGLACWFSINSKNKSWLGHNPGGEASSPNHSAPDPPPNVHPPKLIV